MPVPTDPAPHNAEEDSPPRIPVNPESRKGESAGEHLAANGTGNMQRMLRAMSRFMARPLQSMSTRSTGLAQSGEGVGKGQPTTEPQMLKLSLADGTNVYVNPAAIAYMQQLPDVKGGKNQAKTKIVLMTGDSVSVRQGPNQILVAGGQPLPPKKPKGPAAESPDE